MWLLKVILCLCKLIIILHLKLYHVLSCLLINDTHVSILNQLYINACWNLYKFIWLNPVTHITKSKC